MNKLKNRRNHSYTIDIIRAISAILIVLYHYTWRYNENKYIISINANTDWPFRVSWGCGAVCTFFMLSGFLVAKYFENCNTNPKKYLLKRVVRLYPTFWVCMSITAIVLIILFPETQITWADYFVNLTMLPSLFKMRYVDGAYWTLGYEIMFAIVFFGILWIKNFRLRKIIIIGLLSISFIEWFYGDSSNSLFKFLRFFLITNQIQVFIAGICVYWIKNASLSKTFYYIVFILCCVLQILQNNSPVNNIFFFSTLILLFMSSFLDEFITENIVYRIIEFVALVSYPLYLLHQMIGFSIIKNLILMGYTSEYWIVLPISISIIFASFVHQYFEKPTSRQDFSKWPNLFIS